jgi:hypothetical protein
MTLSFALFITTALVLVFLLVWALRPPKRGLMSTSEVFEALSEQRHYARLPQILQALRVEDTEYLRDRGHGELIHRIRTERKRVALQYLERLQEDFEVLLEASRILAALSPEVIPMHEYERFKLSLRFAFFCRYLRWRLRLGLQPWSAFGTISDMAGGMTLRLEAATARLGERATMASEFPLFLEKGRGDSE